MKNSVFILSFDRDSISDISSLHDGVTKNALVKNWFHYIKSSYIIVATTNNADILSKSLDAALNGIRYILLEVNIGMRYLILLEKIMVTLIMETMVI